MLVVVLLLPLSSSMYDGEFDHSGGGGGGGGVGDGGRQLSAKAAGNKSVDGRMTACNDEIGRQTTIQQPTNKRRCGGGGSGGGGSATT
jgi:hypothetical protein